MKALSIRQPWAWAILHAGKRHENRSWKTAYRGPLLIHASAHEPTLDEQDVFFNTGIDALGPDHLRTLLNKHALTSLHDLQRGGIIGIVDVTDCVSESYDPWFFGPFGFVLANPRPVEFVPFKGRLGFFDVPDELIKVLT